MKRFLVSSVCAASLLWPSASFAKATLKEALASTYEKNPELDAKRSELEAARSDKIRASSGFLPNIGISASRGRDSIKDKTERVDNHDVHNDSRNIQVSQNLFQGGGSFANYKAANARVAQKEAEFVAEEQKVLFNGVKAYLEIWAKEANLKVSQKAERVFKETLEATLEKLKFGVASQADVEKATSEYQKANAQLAQSQAELAGAIATYESSTSLTYESLEEPEMLVAMPSQMDDVVAKSYAANPNLIQADRAVDEADAKDTISKAAFLPTLDVNASVAHQKRTNSLSDQIDPNTNRLNRSISAELKIPLFKQGSEYADLKQAVNTLEAMKKKRRSTQQELMQAIRSTWANWQAAMSQVNSLTSGVKAATFVKEGVRQEYDFGIKSLFDVYQAEKDLLEAEYKLISAKQQEFMNAYQILSLTGELTSSNLKLIGQHESTPPSIKEAPSKTEPLPEEKTT